MKTRIISGIVAGAVAILALFLIDTPVFSILISIICGLAAYEIETVAKISNKPILFFSIVFSAMVPLYIDYQSFFDTKVTVSVVVIAYILLLLTLMLAKFEKTKFEHVTIAVFASVFVPLSLSTFILIRDIDIKFPELTHKEGFYLVLFALLSSCMTDTFAYFVGSKFGKHKLCPKISPKKTVEGAAGGVLGAVLFNVIVFVIFKKFIIMDTNISYLFVIIMTAILSVISMLGDLSASTIKRNYGAKDFGKLIPGHGGIMDRMDSCLFVLPALYACINLIY